MWARLHSRISEETIGVRMVAVLTAAMGVVNVLSAVRPSMQYRLRLLEQYSPLQVTHGGHLTSALAGFALLLLASGLWRRKRVAWLLALLVLLASIVTHLLKGLDYEETRRIVARNDEIGSLGRNMDKLFGSLIEITGNIKGASAEVSSGATQLSTMSQGLSQGASEQAASTQT